MPPLNTKRRSRAAAGRTARAAAVAAAAARLALHIIVYNRRKLALVDVAEMRDVQLLPRRLRKLVCKAADLFGDILKRSPSSSRATIVATHDKIVARDDAAVLREHLKAGARKIVIKRAQIFEAAKAAAELVEV